MLRRGGNSHLPLIIFLSRKIVGITVDMQYHVNGIVLNSGVRVCGNVCKELLYGFFFIFGWLWCVVGQLFPAQQVSCR